MAKPADAPVLILRSGYASSALWNRAIDLARAAGRTVIAIPDGPAEQRTPSKRRRRRPSMCSPAGCEGWRRMKLAESAREAGADDPAGPPTIEDVLANLASRVPEGEWGKLPADLTDNLDHYL